MSMGPSSATVACASCSISDSTPASAAWMAIGCPSALNAARSSSNRSFRRADAMTRAPSRASSFAEARPIPLDAPTTSTTWSCRETDMQPVVYWICGRRFHTPALRSGGQRRANIRPVAGRHPQEAAHHVRIEMRAGAPLDLLPGGSKGLRLSVEAPGGHHVQAVRHGEHARAEGNLLSPQDRKITGAVETLVVRQHDLRGGRQRLDAAQNGGADFGVFPHHVPFRLLQLPWLH